MEITDTYIDATGSFERWRLSAQGLEATQSSARLTQRAYTLGEIDLQGLLLARKQALDATLATEQARVEAVRAQSRLMIDAHLGSETAGLPADIRDGFFPVQQRLRLPMLEGQRSLNLSNSVAVAVFEAWRQCGFKTSI